MIVLGQQQHKERNFCKNLSSKNLASETKSFIAQGFHNDDNLHYYGIKLPKRLILFFLPC
jgi:hypothetical protein